MVQNVATEGARQGNSTNRSFSGHILYHDVKSYVFAQKSLWRPESQECSAKQVHDHEASSHGCTTYTYRKSLSGWSGLGKMFTSVSWFSCFLDLESADLSLIKFFWKLWRVLELPRATAPQNSPERSCAYKNEIMKFFHITPKIKQSRYFHFMLS